MMDSSYPSPSPTISPPYPPFSPFGHYSHSNDSLPSSPFHPPATSSSSSSSDTTDSSMDDSNESDPRGSNSKNIQNNNNQNNHNTTNNYHRSNGDDNDHEMNDNNNNNNNNKFNNANNGIIDHHPSNSSSTADMMIDSTYNDPSSLSSSLPLSVSLSPYPLSPIPIPASTIIDTTKESFPKFHIAPFGLLPPLESDGIVAPPLRRLHFLQIGIWTMFHDSRETIQSISDNRFVSPSCVLSHVLYTLNSFPVCPHHPIFIHWHRFTICPTTLSNLYSLFKRYGTRWRSIESIMEKVEEEWQVNVDDVRIARIRYKVEEWNRRLTGEMEEKMKEKRRTEKEMEESRNGGEEGGDGDGKRVKREESHEEEKPEESSNGMTAHQQQYPFSLWSPTANFPPAFAVEVEGESPLPITYPIPFTRQNVLHFFDYSSGEKDGVGNGTIEELYRWFTYTNGNSSQSNVTVGGIEEMLRSLTEESILFKRGNTYFQC